jgi:chlorite dismutase
MSRVETAAVIPEKGWHVLHLFYRIEHGQWSLLSQEEKIAAKTHLSELIQEIRASDQTQLLIFSVVSPKADIGFMLLTPDLHIANAYEKRLSLGLGPDVLQAVYSFLSLTEAGESIFSEAAFAARLEKERHLPPGSEEFQLSIAEFKKRMAKSSHEELYPKLPNWEVFCFYPMSKPRQGDPTGHEMNLDIRKDWMSGHAKIAGQFEGKVLQLVTAGSGLDDADWGVSLFAHDTFYLKEIVDKMRSLAVSSKHLDFGDFYIGLSLPLDALFRRVLL